jgi:hypothetical protein
VAKSLTWVLTAQSGQLLVRVRTCAPACLCLPVSYLSSLSIAAGACVRACVRTSVRACVRACVCACLPISTRARPSSLHTNATTHTDPTTTPTHTHNHTNQPGHAPVRANLGPHRAPPRRLVLLGTDRRRHRRARLPLGGALQVHSGEWAFLGFGGEGRGVGGYD